MSISLRTRMLLLFLAFVLVPMGAVGVVATLSTRLAVESAVQRTLEATSPSGTTETRSDQGAASGRPPASVSTEEILAPLDRVMVTYLALIFLVGAAATIGFRLVSRRIFRSLEDFRGAIEQIGEGDLAPWLPPPGMDELGWLSLALGRMTERIGQMMHSIEQKGRLAVVGEMAAHMAHEVRTPLSSIRMNLQLLDRDIAAGRVPLDARLSIDTSLAEITRLETVVSRMLGFGLPQRGSRSRCHLHEVIEEARDLLATEFSERSIRIRLVFKAESDWIWADRGRLKGVFLDLLINARDAMPEGGEIAVETKLFLGNGGKQMVAAAVSDSGPGVPVADRDEIFHPFFTTKPDGCGIGLPASLRTLREHGGDLYLTQRPDGGAGACFVAVFPLAGAQGEDPEADRLDPGESSALRRSWRRASEPAARRFALPPTDELRTAASQGAGEESPDTRDAPKDPNGGDPPPTP